MANAQDALAKNAEGVRLNQDGDHDGAIKAFTEALALDPDHANIYRNRADAYRAANKTAEADADSSKADELVSGSVEEELEAHRKTAWQRLWGFIARE